MSGFSVGDTVYFPKAPWPPNQGSPYRVISVEPLMVRDEATTSLGEYEITPEDAEILGMTREAPRALGQETQR